jgi:hypothetical protein
MFLHLGKNESVLKEEIIGIFDIDLTTVSGPTKGFLAELQDKKRIVNLCDDLPKSFVLVENKLCESVYITQNSVSSLKKRVEKESAHNYE